MLMSELSLQQHCGIWVAEDLGGISLAAVSQPNHQSIDWERAGRALQLLMDGNISLLYYGNRSQAAEMAVWQGLWCLMNAVANVDQ